MCSFVRLPSVQTAELILEHGLEHDYTPLSATSDAPQAIKFKHLKMKRFASLLFDEEMGVDDPKDDDEQSRTKRQRHE